MTWSYWITFYIDTHCVARGLASATMAAYRDTIGQFREFVREKFDNDHPASVTPRQVLEYIEHLRRERGNGDSAVNRQVTILRNFYRAVVAGGYLEPADNPLTRIPQVKAAAKKLPVTLSPEEIKRLLDAPGEDTVLGLRDRAILSLLYGSGIRASECAGITVADVDFENRSVRVTGKGGHQRSVKINESTKAVLLKYHEARGPAMPQVSFFQSRLRKAMSRGAIYERVRTWARRARIAKRVSPHTLRHTCATHLVHRGVKIVTIRDLLGHRCLSSTQIYLHVTAEHLREAADKHPIMELAPMIEELLPNIKVPWQHPPQRPQAAG